MHNRLVLLGTLFAAVALTAGCDTLPNIDLDVASWFGDSAPSVPPVRPPTPPAAPQPQPAVTAEAPPLAAPTEAIQTQALPAETDTAQNLPVDGMQREDLRSAFGVDDKAASVAGGL